jgi:ATP-dependent HslUV protease subunit HslV
MTTVAYRDGILAADSLATSGDTVTGQAVKLKRLADGRLAAMLGRSGAAQRLLAWIEAGAQGEQPGGDAGVVIVDDDGASYYDDGVSERCSRAPFKAWGTGGCLAMGAMAAGASAEQAVRIACEWDIYTGGDVIALSLHASDCAVHNEPAYPAGECNCRTEA